MSKKNLLADQLNNFSQGLNNPIPTKVIIENKIEEEVDEVLKTQEPIISKKRRSAGDNKIKAGESIQMSIIIPRKMQKELKKFAFDYDYKVNTVVLTALEEYLKTNK